jgi:beta-lactamase regulating signal transducer with metallopeptidase domain
MNATAWLLWCVVQVTVLTCGVAIVYLVVRRLHPRAGAAAAGGGLIMVLALTALVASPWPRWSLSTRQSVAEVSVPNARPGTSLPPRYSAHDSIEHLHDSSSADVTVQAQVETQHVSLWHHFRESIGTLPGDGGAEARSVNWRMWVGVVFFAGMILAAARLLWGVVMVRRLVSRARPVEDSPFDEMVIELRTNLELSSAVAVRESGELATPATVGWWRPIVLLPTSWREWSRDELRAALAHELAHIAGRDYAAWFVARLAVVAHFYHPVVRWLAGRLQLEQELAADMAAARAVGDSTSYLRSLASLALSTPAHRVAGPVRTLIPSRSLLVRRVEMLRTARMNGPRRSVARYATFAIVAFVGLLAAGLRGPGIDLVETATAGAPATDNETGAENAAPVERLGLEFVPADGTVVLSIRAAEITKHKELEKFEQLVSTAKPLMESNLRVSDISEFMLIKYGDFAQSTKTRFVVRFMKAANTETFINSLVTKDHMEKSPESNVWSDDSERVTQTDELTLVIDHVATTPDGEVPSIENALPRWAGEWQNRSDDPIVLAADVRKFISGESHAILFSTVGNNPLSQSLHPLAHEVDWAIVSASLGDKLQVSLVAESDDEGSAATVRDTLQAVFVLLRNMAQMHLRVDLPKQANKPAMAHLTMAKIVGKEVDALLKSAEVKVDGDRVQVTLRSASSIAEIADLVNSVLPSVEEARAAARRSVSINNLKNLQLAMLNYESSMKEFPRAANYEYRKNGHHPTSDAGLRRERSNGRYVSPNPPMQTLTSEHPHSWRVELLPYLERQDLYDQYHFDEPWDSEANQKVLEQMPELFRAPEDPDQGSTNTSYFVITGETTLFPPDQNIKMAKISDGTARTFSIVEAKRPVPWTKPEDIPYSADKPLPELGGWVPGEFLAALVDGSIHNVSLGGDENTLRAWITRAGGEVTNGVLPRN